MIYRLTLPAVALMAVSAAAQNPQAPIRSGVELVRVDVQVTGRDGRPLTGLTPAQFEVNIDGYFHMVKAALDHLHPGSVILNTGSITGLEGSGELLDYSATKGAIHAFTKSLAQALLPRGIRVNCVAPGPVWTPLNPAERDPEDVRDFGSDTPIGRPAQPEEIAPAYVFLASNPDSSYITGQVLSPLGGETRAG